MTNDKIHLKARKHSLRNVKKIVISLKNLSKIFRYKGNLFNSKNLFIHLHYDIPFCLQAKFKQWKKIHIYSFYCWKFYLLSNLNLSEEFEPKIRLLNMRDTYRSCWRVQQMKYCKYNNQDEHTNLNGKAYNKDDFYNFQQINKISILYLVGLSGKSLWILILICVLFFI